jgi:hypothetical protein
MNELLALFVSSEIDILDFKRDIPDLTDKTKLPEFMKDITAITISDGEFSDRFLPETTTLMKSPSPGVAEKSFS